MIYVDTLIKSTAGLFLLNLHTQHGVELSQKKITNHQLRERKKDPYICFTHKVPAAFFCLPKAFRDAQNLMAEWV